MRVRTSSALAAAAMAVITVSSLSAHAGTTMCSALPNPVVVAGSSAIQPLIQAMSGPLAALGQPVTLIYQRQGSCTGVNAVVNDTTPTGACATGACITGTATYVDAGGNSGTCDLDPNGTHVDVGVSDVFVSTCTGQAKPATIGDISGPVQAVDFIAPSASTQRVITFEEAYFVFGFGNSGQVTPWNNQSLFFIRNQLSGTQQVVANSIGVPAARMLGVDAGGSSGVLNSVSASAQPEGTIGILAADVYDNNRNTVKALAFRGRNQRFAYYPDSTSTSRDKINVRQGRYLPFGYLHLISVVDGSSNPVRAGAQTFLDYFLERVQNPPFNILQLEIQANTIPQCAMSVQRAAEGGNLSLYQPTEPCGCYFESQVGTTSCTACTSDAQCGAGKCRRGYCEAR